MVLSAKSHPTRNGFTAIFSPSMARIAASTAKDWSYIDSWLAFKCPENRDILNFERNPATLKALLAVASINERADEGCQLLANAESVTSGESSHFNGYFESGIREHLLSAISAHLSQDGEAALNAIGDAAIHHGTSFPEIEAFSNQLIALQSNLFETSQAILRADTWENLFRCEAKQTIDWLAKMQGQSYQLPSELAKRNQDLQRKSKANLAHLSDTQERQATCMLHEKGSYAMIQLVTQEEEHFLAMLSLKKDLDSQMMAFSGLPSDTNKARDEVDALQQKLREFATRRDAVFENLVEQASPAKRH
ncbi:hypothetical protein NOR_01451 [Metarhizium rileyi]|uniref:HAUS augmin-like complex subunit 1 n=1 Tax=Metarhizium rileyi (strain RCEF 4871) TaxID=1649241 RepID=A0A162JUZ3_METRR|nr:hypothetical protein NOR_01451 [Metarhizium rileyi RCEF 4871]